MQRIGLMRHLLEEVLEPSLGGVEAITAQILDRGDKDFGAERCQDR